MAFLCAQAQAVFVNAPPGGNSGTTPDNGGGYATTGGTFTITNGYTVGATLTNGTLVSFINTDGADVLSFAGSAVVTGNFGDPLGAPSTNEAAQDANASGASSVINFQGTYFRVGDAFSFSPGSNANTTTSFASGSTINTGVSGFIASAPDTGIVQLQGAATLNTSFTGPVHQIIANSLGGTNTITFNQTPITIGTGGIVAFDDGTHATTLAFNAVGAAITAKLIATTANLDIVNFQQTATLTGGIGTSLIPFASVIIGANTSITSSIFAAKTTFPANNTLTLSNGANITGAVDNTTGANGAGTLNFLGNSIVSGTIGATNSLLGLQLNGAGTVELQSSVAATTIEFFAAGTLILDNGANVTGEIETSANNQGTITFLGSSTVSGPVGATALKSINLINIEGAAGTLVNLGNSTINVNNFIFTGTNVAPTTQLQLATSLAGYTIASIDNQTTSNGNGIVTFTGGGIANVGAVGATKALYAVNQAGAGTQITYANNFSATSLNFTTGSSVASAAIFTQNPVTITASINNLTGTNGIGQVQLSFGGTITGNIGVSNSLNALAFNTTNGASQTLTLNGASINATTITIGDNGTVSTLNLQPTSANMAVTANIGATTANVDAISTTGSYTVSITGQIGALATPFHLFSINTPTTVTGNIYATTTNFLSDTSLTLGINNTSSITGLVSTTAGNNTGTLNFLGSSTVTGTVGGVGASLLAINVNGLNSNVSLNSTVYAKNISLSGFGSTLNLLANTTGNVIFNQGSTTVNLSDGVTITGSITNGTSVNPTGILNILGSNTITQAIGASGASLDEVNLTGPGGVVTLQNAVFANSVNLNAANGTLNLNGTLTGSLNFAAAMTTANLASGLTITGAVSNTFAANTGTLNLAGSATINGTLGAGTNGTLLAVNLNGAGTVDLMSTVNAKNIGITVPGAILNLHGSATVTAINFSTTADATSVINLYNGQTITGAVNSITNVGAGTLNFLGGSLGTTVTGNIGTTKSLAAVNLLGVDGIVTLGGTVSAAVISLQGAGGTLNLLGSATTTASPGVAFAAANTTINLSNGQTLTGSIDGTAPNQGTLNFLGASTVTGTIGNTFGLLAINQSGAGDTVNYQNNVKAVNLNFSGSANASSTANFSAGKTFTGNVDNTTGTAGVGILEFQASGTVSGNIGATHSLSQIIFNASNAASTTGTLSGSNVNANTITINDNIIGPGSTLTLNNAGMVLTGNIQALTNNLDTLNILKAASVTGNIGTPSVGFLLVQVAANGPTTINGNVYATQTQFQANNSLTFGGTSSTNGPITVLNAGGSGTLNITGLYTANGVIGTNTNYLNAINITGTANFNSNNVFATAVNVNGGTMEVTGLGGQTLTGGVALTNGGTLALGPNANFVITQSLNMPAGTILSLNMGGSFASTGNVVTNASATIGPGALFTVVNPQNEIPDVSESIVILTSNGGAGGLHPLIYTGGQQFIIGYSTFVNGNTIELTAFTKPIQPYATYTNTTGIAGALDVLVGTIFSGGTVTGALREIVDDLTLFDNIIDLNNALATLAPIVDDAIAEESFSNQRLAFDSINDRMITSLQRKHLLTTYAAGDPNPITGAWAQAFGQRAYQKDRQNIPGYLDNVWGFQFGFDSYFSDQGLVGVAFDYANARIKDYLSDGSTSIVDNYQATLYGQYAFESPLFLNWLASIGYNHYLSHRNINFAFIHLTASGHFHGWQYGVQAELGYDWTQAFVHIVPLISLQYSGLDMNSYTETGAGNASQTVNTPDLAMLLGSAGVRFTRDLIDETALYQPELHIRFFYDFINDSMQTTSQFTGGGPSFVTTGFTPAAFSFNIGASLTTFSEITGLAFTASYDFNIKEQYIENAGYLRLRYECL